MEIDRAITTADKQFIDVELKPRRKKTSRELFTIELHKQEQECVKLGKPFSTHAARDDFQRDIDDQVRQQMREHGSLQHPEEITLPKMDWKKYSDTKNFKITKEDEVPDAHLNKNNPGLNVLVKKTEYKYKDYGNVYRVMESRESAIKRAQERLWESRQAIQPK